MRRAETLRRLLEWIDDDMAKAAIAGEIKRHETLIAGIDNMAGSEESPSEQRKEIVARDAGDIIS